MASNLEFEPGAMALGINSDGHFYNDQMVVTPDQLSAWGQASIAISLKRIADTLAPTEGLTPGQAFAADLEQTAFSIGQQIKRGMEAG